MSFLQTYGYIGIFIVLSILFALLVVFLPFVLTVLKVIPKKPSLIKSAIYECGPETIGKTWVQFNFRYYLYALFFMAFDIETVFFYPWAVAFNKLALFGFVEMLIFVFILLVGYFYAWKKGFLEWK